MKTVSSKILLTLVFLLILFSGIQPAQAMFYPLQLTANAPFTLTYIGTPQQYGEIYAGGNFKITGTVAYNGVESKRVVFEKMPALTLYVLTSDLQYISLVPVRPTK